MTKYLVVSPDRYGRFGHQTTSISTGLLLASVTNTKLITPKYMYFCDKWNNFSDYTRSRFAASMLSGESFRVIYLEKSCPDQHGNRKWDLGDKKQLYELVSNILDAADNSLLYLPFDQSAGTLLNLYNRVEVRDDIKKVFSFTTNKLMKTPYVCIHIRRGDCTPTAHPKWFVSDDFYRQLITKVAQSVPKTYSICICTQGDFSWLQQIVDDNGIDASRFIVRSTNQLFINDSEIEDFVLMKEADVLFSASSSFSYWATILGSHRLVFDVSRSDYHPLRNVKTINPDAKLDITMNDIEITLRQRL